MCVCVCVCVRVFGVYVQKRERECVCVRTRAYEAMKGSILLTPLLCHFSEERGEILPISGPNASPGPLSQVPYLMEEADLRSARFESKYLLKLKRNSKQGYGCTRNETKAGVGLKLCK